MANNPILFNAALSGVFGGINTSRSLSSADAGSYANQGANALAFATLLDGEIPAGGYSQSDADLLGALVQQVISGKGEAGLNLTSVNALIAAFNVARASLEPVSGPTATISPQSVQLWVDPQTTVPPANQDGSIAAPFDSLTDALAAMATIKATVLQPGVIWLGNGNYLNEAWAWGEVGANPDQNALTLIGQGGVLGLGVGTITGAASPENAVLVTVVGVGVQDASHPTRIGIEEIDLANDGTAKALQLRDCAIGSISCNNATSTVNAVNCYIFGSIEANGALHTFTDCNILPNEGGSVQLGGPSVFVNCSTFADGDNLVIGANARFENCRTFEVPEIELGPDVILEFNNCFIAAVAITGDASTDVRLIDCQTDPDTAPHNITAGAIRMQNCRWLGNITALNELFISQATFSQNFEAGHTITSPATIVTDWVSSVPISWDATAPQVIDVLAAGHAPGIYQLTFWGFKITAAVAGSIEASITYNTTGGIAVALDLLDWDDMTLGGGSLLPVDEKGPNVYNLVSDGSDAITLTLTPLGLSGTPLVSLYTSAVLQASVI